MNRTSRQHAGGLLLARDPVPARQVKALAREADIADRTLDRAREAIGAVTRREGFAKGARWLWSLPDPIDRHRSAILAILASSGSAGAYGEHDDDQAADDQAAELCPYPRVREGRGSPGRTSPCGR